MQYRHAPAADRSALDAVLVSAPGRPTLPVRLTVELLGRAREHLTSPDAGSPGPVTVWDPCCGAGVSLTVLGLLCPGIATLAGTDADPGPLDLARRNLALLAPGGPAARASELDELAARHGKESYAYAATAARELVPRSRPQWMVARADTHDGAATRAALAGIAPDVVLADLPHGRQTSWATAVPPTQPAATGVAGPDVGTGARGQTRERGPGVGSGAPGSSARGPGSGPAPEIAFLRAVAGVLAPQAVVVAVGRGRSVPLPPGARALERLRVGHRAAVLVRAGALTGR